MRLATWVLAAALLVLARPARADDDADVKPSYRVVVDRVDHEPAAITGTRLRIQVSALTLQGGRLELSDPKSIKTYVGASELRAPYALGTYGATGEPTAIVLVVQATLDFQEVLPVIAETLDASVLTQLGERTQLAVLAYGDAVGTGKLQTVKAGTTKLRGVATDGTAGDPALLETIERALILLKKAKTEPEGAALRKMILVIGDGRDRAADRERVTRLGQRAAKEGVRIHSFAFSPSDLRRPLLLLGELSKRSLGTFRWLRSAKADSWTPAFTQLNEEISRQYVLTYFLSADEDPAGKKVKVTTVGRTEAASNELKVPEATCGNEPCAGYCTGTVCAIPQEAGGRGILGWLVWIIVGGVGLLVLLGFIGFVMSKRTKPIPLPPGMVMPPGSVPPGKLPKSQPPSGPPRVQLPASAAPTAAANPHLMFLSGPRNGERVPLRHGFMVGKSPDCDLVIEDGYTSTHHAQLGMDAYGNWRVYDRGSTNGTFVNGVRITELTLAHGLTVRFGSTDFRFLAQ